MIGPYVDRYLPTPKDTLALDMAALIDENGAPIEEGDEESFFQEKPFTGTKTIKTSN